MIEAPLESNFDPLLDRAFHPTSLSCLTCSPPLPPEPNRPSLFPDTLDRPSSLYTSIKPAMVKRKYSDEEEFDVHPVSIFCHFLP
jgi:hypothetical protein